MQRIWIMLLRCPKIVYGNMKPSQKSPLVNRICMNRHWLIKTMVPLFLTKMLHWQIGEKKCLRYLNYSSDCWLAGWLIYPKSLFNINSIWCSQSVVEIVSIEFWCVLCVIHLFQKKSSLVQVPWPYLLLALSSSSSSIVSIKTLNWNKSLIKRTTTHR